MCAGSRLSGHPRAANFAAACKNCQQSADHAIYGSVGDRMTRSSKEIFVMLQWALIFLVIALIAGALGFFVLATTAGTIAKVLFVVFLVLFVISLIRGRGRPVVP
jgi:uncharacterized membrane protein YtjA (UPF0391 family)